MCVYVNVCVCVCLCFDNECVSAYVLIALFFCHTRLAHLSTHTHTYTHTDTHTYTQTPTHIIDTRKTENGAHRCINKQGHTHTHTQRHSYIDMDTHTHTFLKN